jgi:dienelactone hydrolase
MAVATPASVMADTHAFLEHLGADRAARPGGVAITGYCMGGRMRDAFA